MMKVLKKRKHSKRFMRLMLGLNLNQFQPKNIINNLTKTVKEKEVDKYWKFLRVKWSMSMTINL